MHTGSRIQRLIIYVFATLVVAFAMPSAARSVGTAMDTLVPGAPATNRLSTAVAKPSMHSIANLGPSPSLRSALEGKETTEYRMTMMMCEE